MSVYGGRLPIGQRVLVKELNAEGTIYESGTPGFLFCGHERIYGVQLDQVACPENFPTTVWHCALQGLTLLEDK